jgi:polyadenylate-binding protein
MSTPVPTPQKAPSASLYVGDLLPEISEGVLFDVFNSVGQVSSIRVCRDTHSRRSLGYAYVNYQSVHDAERAIATLNNTPINGGKQCRIMWSQRDPTVRRLGIGNVFIKNLDSSISHKQLYDLFSPYGNILSCKVALNEVGESKGYGFVHFESQKSAELATREVNDTAHGAAPGKRVFVGPFISRKLRNQQLEGSWTNVFVKDIDPSVTDAEFEQLFAPYGQITSPAIVRKEGQPSFHGFVNFSSHEEALKAVEGLNGKVVAGKPLFCCRAQKKVERRNKLRREWEQQKLNKYQGINLYVKHLEDDIDEERLRKEFAPYGNIVSLKIMTEDGSTVSKGFGFICFENPEEANRAIAEMNGKVLAGCNKPLYVALHEPFEVRRALLAQRHAKTGMRPQGQMYGAPVFYSQTAYPAYPQPIPIAQMQPRGWPQQAYPPQQAMYAAPMQQRGNNRNTRGAARAPQQQPKAKGPRNQQPDQGHVSGDLTLMGLSRESFENQKLLIGERLYPLIHQVKGEMAGRITGMFLDSGWTIEELLSLLSNEAKLHEKIDEAVGVLDKSEAAAQADAQSGSN